MTGAAGADFVSDQCPCKKPARSGRARRGAVAAQGSGTNSVPRCNPRTVHRHSAPITSVASAIALGVAIAIISVITVIMIVIITILSYQEPATSLPVNT